MKAEIANLKAVQADLDEASEEVRSAVSKAIGDAARSIQADARRLVPVDTGNLRNAISVRLRDDGAEVYVDRSKAHYGHLVEFGSHGGRRPAKPFMGPAAELERKQFKQRIAKAADDA